MRTRLGLKRQAPELVRASSSQARSEAKRRHKLVLVLALVPRIWRSGPIESWPERDRERERVAIDVFVDNFRFVSRGQFE